MTDPHLVIYSTGKITTPEQAALAAAKASGCTCEPEITVKGITATISHDDWCALLRREDRN